MAATDIDPDKLKLYSFHLFTKLEGAVTAGMIHLGDRIGLYAAMRDAGHPVTTHELAELTGTQERWVREWAHNQAAARMIELHPGDTFALSPEAAAVLADPDHPAFGMGMFHRLPQTMHALEHVHDSFHTGMCHKNSIVDPIVVELTERLCILRDCGGRSGTHIAQPMHPYSWDRIKIRTAAVGVGFEQWFALFKGWG